MSFVFRSLSYICRRSWISTCKVVCLSDFILHMSLNWAKYLQCRLFFDLYHTYVVEQG